MREISRAFVIGATYFVAGRDPAGMKGSEIAESHADDDLYNGDHGRYVLTMYVHTVHTVHALVGLGSFVITLSFD